LMEPPESQELVANQEHQDCKELQENVELLVPKESEEQKEPED